MDPNTSDNKKEEPSDDSKEESNQNAAGETEEDTGDNKKVQLAESDDTSNEARESASASNGIGGNEGKKDATASGGENEKEDSKETVEESNVLAGGSPNDGDNFNKNETGDNEEERGKDNSGEGIKPKDVEGRGGGGEEEDRLASLKKDSKFTYRDYSHIEPTQSSSQASGGGSSNFPNSSAIRVQKLPAKLNAMISNPEFQHIISWMPHGRSWKVHNPHAFVEEVIPKYFEYTNYNSFVRLVNAWGFRRITKGPDRNSYYHELFLRGMPHLHSKMHRLTSNEKKLPVDPEDEPDFYKISSLCPLPPAATAAPGSGSGMKGMNQAQGGGLGLQNQNPTQLQKQMFAKQQAATMGFHHHHHGMGYPGYGGHPHMGMGPMGGYQHHQGNMGGGMQGPDSNTYQQHQSLQQQRADLIASQQAYEMQLQRLREQERLLYGTSGAGGAPSQANGNGSGSGDGGPGGYLGMGDPMSGRGGMQGVQPGARGASAGPGSMRGLTPEEMDMMARMQQQHQATASLQQGPGDTGGEGGSETGQYGDQQFQNNVH